MLHVVFYAKIGSEKGSFDMTDVLKGINEKLIYRHPHVFGDVKVTGAGDVEKNWEQLKIKAISRFFQVCLHHFPRLSKQTGSRKK